MIVSRYDPAALHEACGIEMAAAGTGGDGWQNPGAAWGRVAPGGRSSPDRHDESEIWVIVEGRGDVVVEGRRHRVEPGAVVRFAPFETHVLENTSADDLLFLTLYWRDARTAQRLAATAPRPRIDGRPVFVFSTPPTPNGDLHLGHLSGPYLGADAFVRFQRLNGVSAWHLTGSDDFQSYVAERASRSGHSPAGTAAHYSAEIAATLRLMDIDVDQYTVTSVDPAYPPALQAFFSRLVGSGHVTPREGPALFHPDSGDYLYEVGVAGRCPTCGSSSGGNICEECGEPNLCVDLVEPSTSRDGGAVRVGSVRRHTLPLHEFREVVATHHRLGRVPARLRELAHRIFGRDRLDLPVSHPSSWGVPPAEPVPEGQVIWVWPEMAYGFLHGIQALGARTGQDWRADTPRSEWKIVHFFGYDNSFYHSILYPVLYRLAFPGWEPDIDYHVNEFLLLDGEKFSTSRGHAIWGKDLVTAETVDSLRFFLSKHRPEGRRTNFELGAYRAEVRHTLVGRWQRWLDDLGHRVGRGYGGTAPDAGVWTPEHTAFLARLGRHLRATGDALDADGFSLNRAARELDGIVADSVAFGERERAVADLDGWRDETRTAVALELAAARLLSACAAPVMPRFAAALAAALGLPPVASWPRDVELVPAGTRIALAGVVFFGDPGPEPGRGDPERPVPERDRSASDTEPGRSGPGPDGRRPGTAHPPGESPAATPRHAEATAP
ncbi:MAG TPA: class I tRNA ligase family protein [Rugosimonospora sp.]|nr:class I tRNA ligase family protein [Rugosimonospora sp.]